MYTPLRFLAFSIFLLSALGSYAGDAPMKMESLLQGRLVRPVVDQRAAEATGLFSSYTADRVYDYYLVYFSAHWCPPCKVFTPKLVQYYNNKQLNDKGIQVILVSQDYTERDMRQYMLGAGMPWPALAFEWKDKLDFINKLAGPGIPDLIFLDAAGTILADSFDGAKYLGPDRVLDYVSRLLLSNERSKSIAAPVVPAPKTSDELRTALGLEALPVAQ